MGDNKFIRWWKYSSFWKLFGLIFGTIIISLISALLIPDAWCLCVILPICIINVILIRKIIPDVLEALFNEME